MNERKYISFDYDFKDKVKQHTLVKSGASKTLILGESYNIVSGLCWKPELKKLKTFPRLNPDEVVVVVSTGFGVVTGFCCCC